ncbi:flagellin [Sphingomonas naphthae]|uniref:Flagellin n=1 Tax=Sphingomonas naphthae TaxID=1813468 RepID=A0ABY7TN47_9SPHN|nr:flagellin [Sphingomonas naphthae]WCT73649.1 flagellin [Sphingomonas naphthae]
MITGTRYRMSAEVNRQANLASQLARAQSDISTTVRLQSASDDALSSARVSEIARMQAGGAVHKTNLESAASQASQVDGTLKTVASAIDRARELMLQGTSGTVNADDRKALVTELRGIVADLNAYRTQVDSRGQALFPETEALQIPIATDVRVAATSSRAKVFESVDTDNGTLDLATIIGNAADALAMDVDADRETAGQSALADINAAVSHVAVVRADQGVRGARIDAVREQLTSLATAQTEERSSLEDTDIGATVARVSALQLSLEAAQAVFAKVNKSTLFDILG